MGDPPETHAERKQLYERVLRTIDHQTGGANQNNDQPAGATLPTICGTLAHRGPEDVDAVKSALKAAVQNDDVLVWQDRDGRKRFTDATSVRNLEAVVAHENTHDHPRLDLIERCSELAEEVDADA